jgi:uncharacterized membrane protein
MDGHGTTAEPGAARPEPGAAQPPGAAPHLPAWRRRTAGEHRWPAALAVLVAVGLQFPLPATIVPGNRFVLPAVEAGVLVVLLVANPFRIDRESSVLRVLGLVNLTVVALANTWSVVLLIRRILTQQPITPGQLLLSGGAIWVTNVIVFALVYWEFDRRGPAARAAGRTAVPDFLFPQMANPELAPRDWEPAFADYLYLAFTNATAFSPTDVLPLSRGAKMIMLAQTVVAITIVVLVVARAVNVLG